MSKYRTNYNNRADLIAFLSKKSSYTHNPKKIKHIQTHCSDVFLVPPFVYKLKKPVNLGFLNYSTLGNREYYCKKEVELNRKLSSGIYLGVKKISKIKGEYVFGDGEETIVYAVLMKMLPEELSLQYLLENNEISKDRLNGIVEKLYNFYIEQKSNRDIENYGKCKNIKSQISKNLTGSYGFVGKTISLAAYKAINYFNSLFFKNKLSLFEYRRDMGFIKDCHGDLRSEHIYLQDDLIQIIDCIEFNDKFRYIDVASDIAFLSMDMDFRGFREFSRFLVSEFSKRFGDKSMYEIIDFYKCYRAFVRGKVESIKSNQVSVSNSERHFSEELAKRYFKLALYYAVLGSLPSIIVIFGVIGTGKSSLAKSFADELSIEVLSSDNIRKNMLKIDPKQKRYEDYGKGIYSQDTTERVYNLMIELAAVNINENKSIILDASFSQKKFRMQVLDLADELDVPVYFIRTTASPEIIEKRLIKRERKKDSLSDGRVEILDQFKEDFEEPKELTKNYFIIETHDLPDETLLKTFKNLAKLKFEYK